MTRILRFVPALAGLLLLLAGGLAAAASGPCPATALAGESYWIASGTPGIDLYIRNRRPAGVANFPAERVLLYVHGATYPSETAFDLPLEGCSWMDYIAAHGYDVYLVDLRGYGRSTRPAEMDRPAADNPPLVDSETAVDDVGSAVRHVLARRGIGRLNLLGWSWGTTLMGAYAERHPEQVQRLVLYAPVWLRDASALAGSGPLGAYRTVTQAAARKRWLNGVPEDKQAALIPPGWFEAWAEATWATDPKAGETTPAQLRAPNGVVQDLRAYWMAGRPFYDPARITAPTLVVHAEWDRDTPTAEALAVFQRLTAAPERRLVEIAEGTHTVIMERNRLRLFGAVQGFLDGH